jgi:NitT/TauT family transport system substrate-binding protein
MPLPDHVAALGNKGVDASASVEPAATIAIQRGFAVLVKGDDEVIPNHQIAVLLYSEKFANNPDAAKRFMRAYIKAVRFYNGALKDGHLAGPNADEVIAILTQSTPIKDAAIYKAITPTGMNPDGKLNVQSLADDAAFYKSQNLITGNIRVEDVVDTSFIEAAVKELGPYKK